MCHLEQGEQVVSLPLRIMIAELRPIRVKAVLPVSH
jgi:hypothetical protein